MKVILWFIWIYHPTWEYVQQLAQLLLKSIPLKRCYTVQFFVQLFSQWLDLLRCSLGTTEPGVLWGCSAHKCHNIISVQTRSLITINITNSITALYLKYTILHLSIYPFQNIFQGEHALGPPRKFLVFGQSYLPLAPPPRI